MPRMPGIGRAKSFVLEKSRESRIFRGLGEGLRILLGGAVTVDV